MALMMNRTILPDQVAAWLGDVFGSPVECQVSLLSRSPGSEIHAIAATIGGKIRDLILRIVIMPDWLRRESNLIEREAKALELVRHLALPTPHLVACDPSGQRTGGPALLMTRVYGHAWPDRRRPSQHCLAQLARWLRVLHESYLGDAAVRQLPAYRPHHWPALTTASPPKWSQAPALWRRATGVVGCWHLQTTPSRTTLLHRDYRLENVLWDGDRVVGLVDWITACHGHPQSDIGHCRWNLCKGHGLEAMQFFTRSYGLAEYDPLWDLLAALGGIYDAPPTDLTQAANIDAFVAHALATYEGDLR